MLSLIAKKLDLNSVRQHVRIAQKVLNMAMLAAKAAYEQDPSRYPSLQVALWGSLECKPGWTRTSVNSWEFSNGDAVDAQDGELIASVFLSMLVVELVPKFKTAPWREELFETILDEWREQQLRIGTPSGLVEEMMNSNGYVAYCHALLSSQ